MNRLPPLIGAALCVVLWGTSQASAQIESRVLGSGGTQTFQGETRLCVTLGQALVGGIAGSGLHANQGFWHPTAAEKSATGSDEHTVSLTLTALPNPFSESVTLHFSVPNSGRISLELYDALGRRVRTLLTEEYNAGPATVSFDLDDLASGSYTAMLRIGEERTATTLILID